MIFRMMRKREPSPVHPSRTTATTACYSFKIFGAPRFIGYTAGVVGKRNKGIPTDSELELLQVLWVRGGSTTREVVHHLRRSSRAEYNAIQRQLDIMVDKGFVRRDQSGPLHFFYPAVKEDSIQRSVLRDIFSRLFRGNSQGLLRQALSSAKAPQQHIDEIARHFEELKQQKKRKPK